MAAGLRGPGRRAASVAVAALAAAALTGCGGAGPIAGQGSQSRLPTPLPSLTTTLSATAAQLRAELEAVGLRLDRAVGPVRPSEPRSLTMTPRAALRASLADPSEGFVFLYDLTDAPEARERAEELADYLGSGFGQTNFAPDAQFSVAVVDDTVVFTWWSRSRAADPETAEAAFEALRRVGVPVEVAK